MSGSRRNTSGTSARFESYENTAADYEELPEITDADLARAVFLRNGVPRGRPPVGDRPKTAVSLRLDRDVVEYYRATGAGWQTRINGILKRAANLEKDPA